jgi:MFS family permease
MQPGYPATRAFRWPRLNADERTLLALLGAAAFFDRYDESLFSLLLVQIQADLGIADAHVGLLGSLVRLGALPAVALGFLADRVGRRRILVVTIIGYAAMTGATALAPNAAAFVAFQFLAVPPSRCPPAARSSCGPSSPPRPAGATR